MAIQSKLEAALEYERRGFSVILLHGIIDAQCTCNRGGSCESPGKHPIGKWKQYQETRANPLELTELLERHPHANMGIVTGEISGLVVLDVDDIPALLADPKIMGPLTVLTTPTVFTGRENGGAHFYFKYPNSRMRNFVKNLPYLDGRGDGGYVVAPPSQHISGKKYHFRDGGDLSIPLAVLPEIFREMFQSSPGSQLPFRTEVGDATNSSRKLEKSLQSVLSATVGTRNEVLNKESFSIGLNMRGSSPDRKMVQEKLLDAALQSGLPEHEARVTIKRSIAEGISKAEKNPSDSGFNDLNLAIEVSARITPPIFPLDVLGPKWKKWVVEKAEKCSSPVDYVAGSLLITASTMIGNSRRISPWAGWSEPSHLWGMMIGDPSSGKTPGLKPVRALVEPIELRMENEHKSELDKYYEQQKSSKEAVEKHKQGCKEAKQKGEPQPEQPDASREPVMPVCSQIIVNDATAEKLGLICQANSKGVLFFRDELVGWINDFGRYGNDGDRQRWLEAYNGDRQRIDRVKHPIPVIIPHFSVGVLGGIQPERFVASIIRTEDDGLASRFLYFWPDPVPPKRPTNRGVSNSFAQDAFAKLDGLNLRQDEQGLEQPITKFLEDDAADFFQEWRVEHVAEKPKGLPLKGHFGKLPGLVLRLSNCLEHLRWAANNRAESPNSIRTDEINKVSLASIKDGILLVEDYFKSTARRVFAEAEIPEQDRLATQLAGWIRQSKSERFNARQLRVKADGPGIKDAKKMAAACEALKDHGWIKCVGERADGQPGRKRNDWEVNPAIW